ncbi:unnamed protein product [Ixodes pacificus]
MGTTVAEVVVPSEVLAAEEDLGNVGDLTELEGEEPVVLFEVLVEEEGLEKARGSDLVLGRAVVDAAELAVVQVVVVEVGEDLLAGLGTLLLKKVLHLMDAMVSDVAFSVSMDIRVCQEIRGNRGLDLAVVEAEVVETERVPAQLEFVAVGEQVRVPGEVLVVRVGKQVLVEDLV